MNYILGTRVELLELKYQTRLVPLVYPLLKKLDFEVLEFVVLDFEEPVLKY